MLSCNTTNGWAIGGSSRGRAGGSAPDNWQGSEDLGVEHPAVAPDIAGRLGELLRPQAYAHLATDIQLRETHISWVILAGEYAYKIRKPVNFDFLDFSSLENRLAD